MPVFKRRGGAYDLLGEEEGGERKKSQQKPASQPCAVGGTLGGKYKELAGPATTERKEGGRAKSRRGGKRESDGKARPALS